MRISSKGQVTIPADIRKRAGLVSGTEVEVRFDGAAVTIVRVKSPIGTERVARMKGTGDIAMTTDEIMALTRGE